MDSSDDDAQIVHKKEGRLNYPKSLVASTGENPSRQPVP
jgi:hypothetical protein